MLAEALREVQAAIGAQDWHTALGRALTAWRLSRSSELADLIDRITARCTLPSPPHTRGAVHRWWMTNAMGPDPLMIGALVGTWTQRLYAADMTWEVVRARWPSNPLIDAIAALDPPRYLVKYHLREGTPYIWNRTVSNWVDRAAAMLTWPDDPRVARALATLLSDIYLQLEGEVSPGPWQVIADKLRALRDRRIAVILARMPQPPLRQLRGVEALIAEFPIEPVGIAPENAEVAASVPRTPERVDRSLELASLWREVGERPDDDAPRLVLGDALLAGGDNRGELLVLQCAPDRAPRHDVQARRLLKHEWDRWFGDVARLLAKRGTEVRRGMLEKIRVGINDTPSWAWETVAGHHELVAVREVRPAMAPPAAYAKFVAALPRFPRLLQIDAPEVIEALVAASPNTPLEHLYYAQTTNLLPYGRERPPVEDVFGMLATLAPALSTLDLGTSWWHGGRDEQNNDPPTGRFVELLAMIRALLPKLSRLRIERRAVRDDARLAVAAVPGVELFDGYLG